MQSLRPSDAAHLLRRAAWGGTSTEIEAVLDLGLDAAVDRLLDPARAPVVGEPLRRPGFDAYDLGAFQTWFVRLAATSPTPAIERLTWFWSGHFATSIEKVETPDLLHRQFTTCRHLGLGHFGDLLKAISRDAAMNLWLDLYLSVAGNPNENFARELMELFSMGPRAYTQADVVSAARAFTGYGLEEIAGRTIGTKLLHGAHDHGEKTFLGHRGHFDGDDIIDHIVERPECHTFMARRFWHRYAGTTPEPDVVRRIAAAFAERGHTSDLLRAMLTDPAFYTDEVMAGLVSQPAELLIRAVRGFGLELVDVETTSFEETDEEFDEEDAELVSAAMPPWFVGETCERLGQEIGLPPNVAGWPHNEAWLDSNRAANRLLVGVDLGRTIARLDTAVGERLRRAATRTADTSTGSADFAQLLFEHFGVLEVSPETGDAITAAVVETDPIEAVAAAFAVAFTSPEWTLA